MTHKDNMEDPLADPLANIRKRIDEIDVSIQDLVSERASCAASVAKVKQQQGETGHFYRPEREAQVLRAVMERNTGPLNDESIAGIFREIMAACLAHEKPLKVAFLGPEGTYTHSAAVKHFGSLIETQPVQSIEEVFRTVEADGANFGVVPVENSSAGVINHTLDLFMKSSLTISGEVALRIRHNLLSNLGSLEKIDRVYAHQQSLSQCNQWLDKNLPDAERIAMSSNAQAVLHAKENNAASIGGTMAADLYDMDNVLMVGNPAFFSVHNVKTLVYHGDTIFDIIEKIRVPQSDVVSPMIQMLKKRHLGPMYGKKTGMIPERKDYLVIEEVPDVLHMGHVHVNGYTVYRGTTLINSGTWQAQTEYQVLRNMIPTPCRVPIFNLKTHKTMITNFG